MPLKTEPFDPTRHLTDADSVRWYLEDIVQSGDARVIARGIGYVARAKGMADIAERTGLSRESLYRALGEDGNPQLSTILKVLDALGLQLRVEPKHDDAA